jgi:hypothetical protein
LASNLAGRVQNKKIIANHESLVHILAENAGFLALFWGPWQRHATGFTSSEKPQSTAQLLMS